MNAGRTVFSQVMEYSYINNAGQVRRMLAAGGNVLTRFFGRKDRGRCTVYGGVTVVAPSTAGKTCTRSCGRRVHDAAD